VFGFSFLEQNMDRVKAATIDGIAPTADTIADGSYPPACSLYIYVKKQHLGIIPGLKEFVMEFMSDAAAGRAATCRTAAWCRYPPPNWPPSAPSRRR
jgi:phosphate transport system substrate-binding protein